MAHRGIRNKFSVNASAPFTFSVCPAARLDAPGPRSQAPLHQNTCPLLNKSWNNAQLNTKKFAILGLDFERQSHKFKRRKNTIRNLTIIKPMQCNGGYSSKFCTDTIRIHICCKTNNKKSATFRSKIQRIQNFAIYIYIWLTSIFFIKKLSLLTNGYINSNIVP